MLLKGRRECFVPKLLSTHSPTALVIPLRGAGQVRMGDDFPGLICNQHHAFIPHPQPCHKLRQVCQFHVQARHSRERAVLGNQRMCYGDPGPSIREEDVEISPVQPSCLFRAHVPRPRARVVLHISGALGANRAALEVSVLPGHCGRLDSPVNHLGREGTVRHSLDHQEVALLVTQVEHGEVAVRLQRLDPHGLDHLCACEDRRVVCQRS